IGFLFSYRMIHYFSLTFILFSSIFYSARIGSDPLLMFYVSLILFLSFSTMITIFIKRFHDIKMQQANELEEKNAALDLLLTEVYALLELSSDIIDSEGAAEKSYLKRTFDIAYKLFKGCHAGYCYQVIDGSIEVIDTRVYKTNEIPYVYETNQIIDNDHDTLFVFPNFKDTLKKTFGNQFGILDEDQYPLLGRTVMPLYYQDNEAFIIVLDRFTKQTSIDERHIERLKHFSLLLDGLYKRNYFVLRNTNLKDEVVLSIVRTLELFDPYTKGHSEDVAALSVELAKHVNNDPAFISELYWAGILHDIGKVGVDGKIIRKPDKLTKEEYEQVKRHTHYGYNVLAEANSLSPIASIVKHHHEWYSGGGYPDGLKDEAIPLASRIISVVDMVATMATDRPYRKRQNKPEIIAELTKWKGIQFDPDLVDKMISLIENNILEGHFKRNYH
ncbi:MAG: HD domain-containing phosphohydrolase, partial [Candidatus Izemoplasmataceae bacterium]